MLFDQLTIHVACESVSVIVVDECHLAKLFLPNIDTAREREPFGVIGFTSTDVGVYAPRPRRHEAKAQPLRTGWLGEIIKPGNVLLITTMAWAILPQPHHEGPVLNVKGRTVASIIAEELSCGLGGVIRLKFTTQDLFLYENRISSPKILPRTYIPAGRADVVPFILASARIVCGVKSEEGFREGTLCDRNGHCKENYDAKTRNCA